MEQEKFKEGDWVKQVRGTQAMTVLGYVEDGQEGAGRRVICSLNDSEGQPIEEVYQEQELELMNN
ncbi:hypothetical protein CLV98_1043 [Dyadobacter jejuensis]|uniref:DUF2158 domain-containing protein n=1 Tax=Dyadobacter jejuensis TaxID=1082580 RepID=A0A316AKJ3_9BACT|nr:hypothetical protein [Dyadobacter jejuensis]PWJ58146.1 hypothetical protein CLV98_1043 [Dyadobacter jejuensis]